MHLFVVFILQIIIAPKGNHLCSVQYRVPFTPASPHLCARVPFVLSTPEDAVFAASVLQLHTANVARVHQVTVLLLNRMTQIYMFFHLHS